MMFSLCILIVLLISTSVHGKLDDKKSYDGYTVWKAIPADADQLRYLQNLFQNGSYMNINFWHPPSKIGKAVDIMIAPNALSSFKLECKDWNINITMFIDNLEKLIDEEQRPVLSSKRRFNVQRSPGTIDFTKYPRLDEIEQYIQNLPLKYPNFVSLQELATTHENRKQYLVKITNKLTDSTKNKQGLWIDGGIHAREWIAPITTLYMIDQLLTTYDSDPSIRNYVDNLVWYVMPVMNPDGYYYTHTTDRMWRKNRRPATCIGWSCCIGVDLNRNFGFHWAETGSSTSSCSELYHGPNPFSEPESQGVQKFLLDNKGSIKAYLTFHSYSQMWFYPYGYRPGVYPSDIDDLKNLAFKATKALQSASGTKYDVGTAPELLYSAAGGSDDWAKGVANIKYSYTIELRPADMMYNNGFVLPPSQIVPTGFETWKAVKVVADEILQNNNIRTNKWRTN